MLSLSEANDLQGFELQINIEKKQQKNKCPSSKALACSQEVIFPIRIIFFDFQITANQPQIWWKKPLRPAGVLFYVRTCSQGLVGSATLTWFHYENEAQARSDQYVYV